MYRSYSRGLTWMFVHDMNVCTSFQPNRTVDLDGERTNLQLVNTLVKAHSVLQCEWKFPVLLNKICLLHTK